MVTTAQAVLTDLGGRYAYTESDEISVLFDPGLTLFGRSVEKLVSISAGIATAAFTYAAGQLVHFDSRPWAGTSISDVDVPARQRRGVGLHWQTYQRAGYDPVQRTEVTATRRIAIDRDLPMKDTYRDCIRTICSEAAIPQC